MKLVNVLVGAAMLLSSASAMAQATQATPVEAVLNAVQFEGETLNYTYVAYDTSNATDRARAVCVEGEFEGRTVLKAVEVKVDLFATFNQPYARVKKSGTFNVGDAKDKCLSKIANQGGHPIEIILPRISISATR